jgi:cell cycle sensor histidine kinase DivJ
MLWPDVRSARTGDTELRRSRFVFLQNAWVLIVAVCAAAALLVRSEEPTRLALAALIAASPAFVGMALNQRIEGPLAQCAIVASWTFVAAWGAALSGGAQSPLAAMFLVAPLLVVMVFEDEGFALVAVVFSAFGYAVASAFAALGMVSAGAGLVEPAPQFGALATLLMAAAFAIAHSASTPLPQGSFRGRVMQLDDVAAQSHAYLRLDREGMIAAVVAGAPSALFGRDDRELVGRPLASLVEEADAAEIVSGVQRARDGGKPSSARAQIAWSSGQRQPGLFGFDPDRTGGVTAHVRAVGPLQPAASSGLHIQTATPHETAQTPQDPASRDLSSPDQALPDVGVRAGLIGEMGHELGTPLNAIMGFADVMNEGVFGPLPERYREYVRHILASGRHMQEVIAGALDLARIEAGRYEPSLTEFDVAQPLQEAIDIAAGLRLSDAAQIHLEVEPAPLLVRADRRAIRQIALNLISNSLKFTPSSGTVNVSARAKGAQDEPVVDLTVRDTGAGITAQDLERLGVAFTQGAEEAGRRRGMGLGLSIVRALAAGHGGRVTIDSKVGEGATVTVRLPIRKMA